MRIGLDFDGTIADWAPAFARWMGALPGTVFDPNRDVSEQVTREQLNAMVRDILGTDLTLEMRPTIGALDAMGRLAAEHELYVITARHEHEAAWAGQWLKRHAVPISGVIHTGRGSKQEPCRRLALDVLLDDSPDVLADVIGTSTLPVLYEHRFSRPERRPLPLECVGDWDAFERLCGDLAVRVTDR